MKNRQTDKQAILQTLGGECNKVGHRTCQTVYNITPAVKREVEPT